MSTTTSSPTIPSPRQGPSIDDLVCLLQAAYLNHPKMWEKVLRNYRQGVSVPADLRPEELAGFTDYVFWQVKQRGIKDPATWLALHQARQEAAATPAAEIDWEALIETRDSVDPEPVKLELDSVSSEPSPTPVAATITLSPSEIAKNEIAIGGHPHVSNQRLASMLGISERTLSRLSRNGDGPPHVKITGNYYRLDKIREWAAARGLRLKTPSENH